MISRIYNCWLFLKLRNEYHQQHNSLLRGRILLDKKEIAWKNTVL